MTTPVKKSRKKAEAVIPMVTLRQVRSVARCTERQRLTLTGLGLGRIGRVRVLKDTPSMRGRLLKVAHLVEVLQNDPVA